MTTIISIDPGYDRIGVAILEKEIGSREVLVSSQCIETNREDSLDDRIAAMAKIIAEIITEYQPTALAIENLFMKNNKNTAMGVAEARGVIKYIAGQAGLSVHEFNPLQIKTAVTGYGKSTKDQVQMMVEKLITLPDRKMRDDEIDAIAIGLTYFAHAPLIQQTNISP